MKYIIILLFVNSIYSANVEYPTDYIASVKMFQLLNVNTMVPKWHILDKTNIVGRYEVQLNSGEIKEMQLFESGEFSWDSNVGIDELVRWKVEGDFIVVRNSKNRSIKLLIGSTVKGLCAINADIPASILTRKDG